MWLLLWYGHGQPWGVLRVVELLSSIRSNLRLSVTLLLKKSTPIIQPPWLMQVVLTLYVTFILIHGFIVDLIESSVFLLLLRPKKKNHTDHSATAVNAGLFDYLRHFFVLLHAFIVDLIKLLFLTKKSTPIIPLQQFMQVILTFIRHVLGKFALHGIILLHFSSFHLGQSFTAVEYKKPFCIHFTQLFFIYSRFIPALPPRTSQLRFRLSTSAFFLLSWSRI